MLPKRKLRASQPDWRREGWIPLSVLKVTSHERGRRVDGLRIEDECLISFIVEDGIELGAEFPLFYRSFDSLLGDIEIAYFDAASGELNSARAMARRI